MEFKEFTEVICKLVQNHLEHCNVHLEEVMKNNGVKLYGVCIREQNSNIAPTIYLEEHYDSYQKGMTIDEIVWHICQQYQSCKRGGIQSVGKLLDFQYMKPMIAYRLVNYEKNVERLQEMPYIPFEDLAITFYCMLDCRLGRSVTVPITNRHMEAWNLNIDELYQIAHKNTPIILPSVVYDMDHILREIAKEEGSKNLSELTSKKQMHSGESMYVLTNTNKNLGACCILYEKLLSDFASALGNSFFLLPSSIHEMILLPDTGTMQAEELLFMVKEVNATQVEPEEILSDHVYYYVKEADTLITY